VKSLSVARVIIASLFTDFETLWSKVPSSSLPIPKISFLKSAAV
jgi:hypothetical protein